MTPDTPDDTNISTIHTGQISPGCPTAGAVLDVYNEWPQPLNPAPPLPYRTNFAPIIPPARARDPSTFPRPGSFILFQLDKQKLANQLPVPEDSGSLERCLALPTKRYVGLVVGSFRGENDSDAEERVIAFVSKSLPPGSKPSPECDSFTVPIAHTKMDGVNGRLPLHPRSFPWTGCHQYTVLGARITPTRTYLSAIEYGLDEGDLCAFDTFVMEDRATLARHRHTVSSIFDEKEALLFENMRMSDSTIPLPVKVWQELTVELECHDPRDFVQEVSDFKELALVAVEGLGCQ